MVIILLSLGLLELTWVASRMDVKPADTMREVVENRRIFDDFKIVLDLRIKELLANEETNQILLKAIFAKLKDY